MAYMILEAITTFILFGAAIFLVKLLVIDKNREDKK